MEEVAAQSGFNIVNFLLKVGIGGISILCK